MLHIFIVYNSELYRTKLYSQGNWKYATNLSTLFSVVGYGSMTVKEVSYTGPERGMLEGRVVMFAFCMSENCEGSLIAMLSTPHYEHGSNIDSNSPEIMGFSSGFLSTTGFEHKVREYADNHDEGTHKGNGNVYVATLRNVSFSVGLRALIQSGEIGPAQVE